MGIKKSIGWCDYTLNPIKGKCPMGCDYCYARRIYDRFKWNPEIRYEDPFWQFHKLKGKPPCRVFVGSTIELFGDWIRPEWWHNIFSYCRAYSEHSFLFLTKLPQNLPKAIVAIGGKLPENCWMGMTVTDKRDFIRCHHYLYNVDAKVKFLSIEPLLGRCNISKDILALYDWVIIGQQTPVSKKTEPKISWIKEIVEAADKAGVKVFQKDNLKPLLGNSLRQEMP